ncbi:hypothetical protein XA68_15693 [Ophiocordyceps unilateralis]|uniref:Core Histone H2A/H2B/H3 domain-containing protein n=1 Tax=Ophiocordyceps unilateralis TaxID=268505 RepID=A0A2A9P7I9_OPHUN|nr:hypothetical protein XA68_15693 [Ophiocordyceps unilateralis]
MSSRGHHPRGFRVSMRARRELAIAPLVVPRRIFARIFREILNELGRGDLRFEVQARHALQDAAENLLIAMFSAAGAIARNGRRGVVRPDDLMVLRETLSIFAPIPSNPFSSMFPREYLTGQHPQ